MSKKVVTVKPEPKREFVVVQTMRRGIDIYHSFHGPFTKGEAGAYAMHADTYGKVECSVKHMAPLQHHEKWILKEVD